MPSKIKAMLVMAQERRRTLLDLLECCGIEVVSACDCNEARRMLETQPPVQAVVTDRSLPDGDWREVLEIVAQGRAYVQVVVCSRLGYHTLLIDVLEQGGSALRTTVNRVSARSSLITVKSPASSAATNRSDSSAR
jgi:CheY-like chemotaxis protein